MVLRFKIPAMGCMLPLKQKQLTGFWPKWDIAESKRSPKVFPGLFLAGLLLGGLCFQIPQAHSLTPVTIEIEAREMQLAPKVRKNNLNHIFQFDRSELGDRYPVIMMPGRAEEFQHSAWWKRFRKMAAQDENFTKHYKLYAYIYDSGAELDKQAQDFVKEFKEYFGGLPQEKKVVLLSYSLGGVISREAMEDPEVFDRIHTVIAIGVPFHGSPIFDPDWFTKYLRPRNHSPIRQLWDRVIYRIYLMTKTNLTRGLKWNNFDGSLPQFKLDNHEIKGDQIVGRVQPFEERPSTAQIKKKIIVYASYLENQYTQLQDPSLDIPKIQGGNPALIPKEIVGALLPLYGASTHAVFIYMNHQLANLPTFSESDKQGANHHTYQYNDGVIPLSSALYLPPRKTPYDGHLDQFIPAIDVQKARIFVNIDHMHLGEYSILRNKTLAVDILHPKEGKMTPNIWLLKDLETIYPTLPPQK
ncbi:MAG: GPI inositol-deacylase [Cyanobacteria bacterium]|nr:GPI inositol-deacylase [Cyanobacteriota bacterium]